MTLKFLTSFGILVLLGSCVTAADFDRRLSLWVGHDGDDLASAWGAPVGTYRKKNGDAILTYQRSSIMTSGPGPFIQTFSRQCRIDVLTDPQGKIKSITWQGDIGQCDFFAEPPLGAAPPSP